MRMFLTFLPIVILITAVLISRFNGRRELLKMDLVQFIYAFVLTPTILIWIKTVVFLNMDKELGVIDLEDKFLIDTIITITSFFIYAFVVIHSLTKTFAIRKSKDPLFDIFARSEYLHLWLSHVVIYSSGLLVVLFVGGLNIFFPITLILQKSTLHLGITIGIILSLVFYYAIWSYRTAEPKNFDRVMKLQIYIYTFLLLAVYTILRPEFSPQFTLFWSSAIFFVSTAALSQTLKRGNAKNLYISKKESTLGF